MEMPALPSPPTRRDGRPVDLDKQPCHEHNSVWCRTQRRRGKAPANSAQMQWRQPAGPLPEVSRCNNIRDQFGFG